MSIECPKKYSSYESMDLHRLRVVGFDTLLSEDYTEKKNITELEKCKQEECTDISTDDKRNKTNELVTDKSSGDNIRSPKRSSLIKSKSEIFRIPSNYKLKKRASKTISSFEDVTKIAKARLKPKQKKRSLNLFNRKSTIDQKGEDTKKPRHGHNRNEEIHFLFARESPTFTRHSRKRAKNEGPKKCYDYKRPDDIFGLKKSNRYVDPCLYHMSCNYLNIDKLKKMRFRQKVKPSQSQPIHCICKHHAMRVLTSGIAISNSKERDPSIYYNLNTHSPMLKTRSTTKPRKTRFRCDYSYSEESGRRDSSIYKCKDQNISVSPSSLLPIERNIRDAYAGPSKADISLHHQTVVDTEPPTFYPSSQRSKRPRPRSHSTPSPSTSCKPLVRNRSRAAFYKNKNDDIKNISSIGKGPRGKVITGAINDFIHNISEAKNGPAGKNCIKYAFFGLLILVWTPCLLLVILAWVVMCPVRMTNVLAQEKTRKSFLNSFMNRFRKKTPERYQRTSQNPKAILSSVVNWYTRTAGSIMSTCNGMLSMLRPKHTPRCDKSRSAMSPHPNPKKRYTLFYADNRGWMMKPARRSTTRSCYSSRVVQSMRCEFLPKRWQKFKPRHTQRILKDMGTTCEPSIIVCDNDNQYNMTRQSSPRGKSRKKSIRAPHVRNRVVIPCSALRANRPDTSKQMKQVNISKKQNYPTSQIVNTSMYQTVKTKPVNMNQIRGTDIPQKNFCTALGLMLYCPCVTKNNLYKYTNHSVKCPQRQINNCVKHEKECCCFKKCNFNYWPQINNFLKDRLKVSNKKNNKKCKKPVRTRNRCNMADLSQSALTKQEKTSTNKITMADKCQSISQNEILPKVPKISLNKCCRSDKQKGILDRSRKNENCTLKETTCQANQADQTAVIDKFCRSDKQKDILDRSRKNENCTLKETTCQAIQAEQSAVIDKFCRSDKQKDILDRSRKNENCTLKDTTCQAIQAEQSAVTTKAICSTCELRYTTEKGIQMEPQSNKAGLSVPQQTSKTSGQMCKCCIINAEQDAQTNLEPPKKAVKYPCTNVLCKKNVEELSSTENEEAQLNSKMVFCPSSNTRTEYHLHNHNLQRLADTLNKSSEAKEPVPIECACQTRSITRQNKKGTAAPKQFPGKLSKNQLVERGCLTGSTTAVKLKRELYVAKTGEQSMKQAVLPKNTEICNCPTDQMIALRTGQTESQQSTLKTILFDCSCLKVENPLKQGEISQTSLFSLENKKSSSAKNSILFRNSFDSGYRIQPGKTDIGIHCCHDAERNPQSFLKKNVQQQFSFYDTAVDRKTNFSYNIIDNTRRMSFNNTHPQNQQTINSRRSYNIQQSRVNNMETLYDHKTVNADLPQSELSNLTSSEDENKRSQQRYSFEFCPCTEADANISNENIDSDQQKIAVSDNKSSTSDKKNIKQIQTQTSQIFVVANCKCKKIEISNAETKIPIKNNETAINHQQIKLEEKPHTKIAENIDRGSQYYKTTKDTGVNHKKALKTTSNKQTQKILTVRDQSSGIGPKSVYQLNVTSNDNASSPSNSLKNRESFSESIKGSIKSLINGSKHVIAKHTQITQTPLHKSKILDKSRKDKLDKKRDPKIQTQTAFISTDNDCLINLNAHDSKTDRSIKNKTKEKKAKKNKTSRNIHQECNCFESSASPIKKQASKELVHKINKTKKKKVVKERKLPKTLHSKCDNYLRYSASLYKIRNSDRKTYRSQKRSQHHYRLSRDDSSCASKCRLDETTSMIVISPECSCCEGKLNVPIHPITIEPKSKSALRTSTSPFKNPPKKIGFAELQCSCTHDPSNANLTNNLRKTVQTDKSHSRLLDHSANKFAQVLMLSKKTKPSGYRRRPKDKFNKLSYYSSTLENMLPQILVQPEIMTPSWTPKDVTYQNKIAHYSSARENEAPQMPMQTKEPSGHSRTPKDVNYQNKAANYSSTLPNELPQMPMQPQTMELSGYRRTPKDVNYQNKAANYSSTLPNELPQMPMQPQSMKLSGYRRTPKDVNYQNKAANYSTTLPNELPQMPMQPQTMKASGYHCTPVDVIYQDEAAHYSSTIAKEIPQMLPQTTIPSEYCQMPKPNDKIAHHSSSLNRTDKINITENDVKQSYVTHDMCSCSVEQSSQFSPNKISCHKNKASRFLNKIHCNFFNRKISKQQKIHEQSFIPPPTCVNVSKCNCMIEKQKSSQITSKPADVAEKSHSTEHPLFNSSNSSKYYSALSYSYENKSSSQSKPIPVDESHRRRSRRSISQKFKISKDSSSSMQPCYKYTKTALQPSPPVYYNHTECDCKVDKTSSQVISDKKSLIKQVSKLVDNSYFCKCSLSRQSKMPQRSHYTPNSGHAECHVVNNISTSLFSHSDSSLHNSSVVHKFYPKHPQPQRSLSSSIVMSVNAIKCLYSHGLRSLKQNEETLKSRSQRYARQKYEKKHYSSKAKYQQTKNDPSNTKIYGKQNLLSEPISHYCKTIFNTKALPKKSLQYDSHYNPETVKLLADKLRLSSDQISFDSGTLKKNTSSEYIPGKCKCKCFRKKLHNLSEKLSQYSKNTRTSECTYHTNTQIASSDLVRKKLSISNVLAGKRPKFSRHRMKQPPVKPVPSSEFCQPPKCEQEKPSQTDPILIIPGQCTCKERTSLPDHKLELSPCLHRLKPSADKQPRGTLLNEEPLGFRQRLSNQQPDSSASGAVQRDISDSITVSQLPESTRTLTSESVRFPRNTLGIGKQSRLSQHVQSEQPTIDKQSRQFSQDDQPRPSKPPTSQQTAISKRPRQLSFQPTTPSTEKESLEIDSKSQHRERNFPVPEDQPRLSKRQPNLQLSILKQSRQLSAPPTPTVIKHRLQSDTRSQLPQRTIPVPEDQPRFSKLLPCQQSIISKQPLRYSFQATPLADKQEHQIKPCRETLGPDCLTEYPHRQPIQEPRFSQADIPQRLLGQHSLDHPIQQSELSLVQQPKFFQDHQGRKLEIPQRDSGQKLEIHLNESRHQSGFSNQLDKQPGTSQDSPSQQQLEQSGLKPDFLFDQPGEQIKYSLDQLGLQRGYLQDQSCLPLKHTPGQSSQQYGYSRGQIGQQPRHSPGQPDQQLKYLQGQPSQQLRYLQIQTGQHSEYSCGKTVQQPRLSPDQSGQQSRHSQGQIGQQPQYSHGQTGQQPRYSQGQLGQQLRYSHGQPGQQPRYLQGQIGQQPEYSHGQTGQQPTYSQGQPGQQLRYSYGQTGQQPRYLHGQLGQRSEYSRGQTGQQPRLSQDQSGQQSRHSQGQSDQQPEYSHGQIGQQPRYSQGQPGQQLRYSQGQPGQQPRYLQGQIGQQPEYTHGQTRQQPTYSQGQPGQQLRYSHGQPGQQPRYLHSQLGQRSEYSRGQTGQQPRLSQDQSGQQSRHSQGQSDQQPEYSHGQIGQQPRYSQGQPGQQLRYSQGQPGQQPRYLQFQPGQQPRFSQDQLGQQPELLHIRPDQQPGYLQGQPDLQPRHLQGQKGQHPVYLRGQLSQQPRYFQSQPGQQPEYSRGQTGQQPELPHICPDQQLGYSQRQPDLQPRPDKQTSLGQTIQQPGYSQCQLGQQPRSSQDQLRVYKHSPGQSNQQPSDLRGQIRQQPTNHLRAQNLSSNKPEIVISSHAKRSRLLQPKISKKKRMSNSKLGKISLGTSVPPRKKLNYSNAMSQYPYRTTTKIQTGYRQLLSNRGPYTLQSSTPINNSATILAGYCSNFAKKTQSTYNNKLPKHSNSKNKFSRQFPHITVQRSEIAQESPSTRPYLTKKTSNKALQPNKKSSVPPKTAVCHAMPNCYVDKLPPGLLQPRSTGLLRRKCPAEAGKQKLPPPPCPGFSHVRLCYPDDCPVSKNNQTEHIPPPAKYQSATGASPPNYAEYPYSLKTKRSGPKMNNELDVRRSYKLRPLKIKAPKCMKCLKTLSKSKNVNTDKVKIEAKKNKTTKNKTTKPKKKKKKKREEQKEGLLECLINTVQEVEKEIWPTEDFSCPPMYIHALKRRPCFWIYNVCPSIYPSFLNFYKFQQSVCQMSMYVIAFCFWCPFIICTYLCCSSMCGGGS